MKTLNHFLLITGIFSMLILVKEIEGGRRSEILDPDGKYHVAWEVNDKDRTVTFEVTVNTIGFVGFGISLTGGMAGADIVIGGVFSDGSSYFQDRHAKTNGMPIVDKHQDWTLLQFSENNSVTYLKFSRLINTCDNEDVAITGDAFRLIWAIGQDDKIGYHAANRGSYFVNILDPPTPEIDLSGHKSFDAIVDVTMPSRFGPKIIGHIAQKHTHHFMFNKCKTPEGEDPDDFFGPFIVHGGEDCFAGTSERSLEIYKYCNYTLYSWAMGARRIHMPEGIGFPISEGGREYFMLEVHLNNPEKISNISFKTGVEIYYTADLRPHEAESFSIGTGSYFPIVIPPSSAGFQVSVHCSPSCTKFIEPEGYTLFNVQLHAHSSGRKLRLRHFRNGTELPWIADDQMYDNNFQNNRNIHPVKLVPGDHLTLECKYDNTWINPPASVIGGYSTRDEMCTSVIYYYPKGRFSICGSNSRPRRLMKLLGINRLSTRAKNNYLIVSPPKLRGIRIQYYMDKMLNWSSSLRSAVQNQLTVGPHDSICVIEGVNEDLIYENQSIITYPEIDNEYQIIDQCFRKKINTSRRSGMTFNIRRGSKNSKMYFM